MNRNTGTFRVRTPIPCEAFEADRLFFYTKKDRSFATPMTWVVWVESELYMAKAESPVQRARNKYHNGRKK